MNPLTRRLARLETATKPAPDYGPSVVRYQPGESREEAIERANPRRPFVLLPTKCADAAAWVAMVAQQAGLA